MKNLARVLVVLLFGLVPSLPTAEGGEINLKKVDGIEKLPGDKPELELLARNGFVVLPRLHKQMFSLYIGGNLPYYVTTDSVHRTYHVLLESALKEVEQGVTTRVRAFLEDLHQRLTSTPLSSGGASADGRALAIGHVAVAARLLGLAAPVPPVLEARVAAEVTLVGAAEARTPSPLFGVPEDYTLYRPRGFYAGDANLAAYFRAVTWLGRRGLRVQDERETWAAIHLVQAIQADDALRRTLEELSSFLDWMVGPADDLTVAEYAAALEPVLAEAATDTELAARFEDARRALAGLRAPEINAQVLEPDAWAAFREETKGLRLLPARRTPDAWLFQRLAEADPASGLPSGLEVALALGSDRAGLHRASRGVEARRRAEQVGVLTPAFLERLDGTHYGATLRTTALLFDKTSPIASGMGKTKGPKGTPLFPASLYASGPWNDRLLTTGLSTWTSLRHAWALHAKITLYALGATRDPAGVVEPAPRFYAALAALARSLVERVDAFGGFGREPRAVLAQVLPLLERVADESMDMADMHRFRAELQILEQHGDALEELCQAKELNDNRACLGMLVPRFQAWLDGKGDLDEAEQAWVDGLATSETRTFLLELAELLDELERIARDELAGKALSDGDADLIRDYGKRIAALNFYGGNAWLEPQEQMGLVATVAADPATNTYVESAVGAAMELYVALPLRGGGRRLYQGGVYAWYEFPSKRPSTDAEWLTRVEQRSTPPLPTWTSSYVPTANLADVVKRIRAGEIVEDVQFLHDEAIGKALIQQFASGKLEDGHQDRHLAWVAMALVPYGESDLRPRIKAALKNRLLHADDRLHGAHHGPVTDSVGDAATIALSELLDAEELPAYLALLRRPPEAAVPEARARIVRLLGSAEDPALAPAADALIQDADPAVRRAGLELRHGLHVRGVGVPAEFVEAVMAYLARTQDDKRRRDAMLYLESEFDKYAGHIDRKHIATLSPLLSSKDPEVVYGAVKLWGHAVGTMPAGDPYYQQATTWLLERFREGPWRVSLGCIEGLAGLGTAEALEAIGEVAADSTVDAKLRYFTIDPLARAGEPGLPHLFPLVFDETQTGSSINQFPLRLCDEAAAVLDKELGGPFGWKEHFEDHTERERALKAARDEARKRGYGP